MVFGMGNNEEVSPENLESLLSEGFKLIDVREQDEWDAGHHTEAAHIPMGTIPERIDEFDEDEKNLTKAWLRTKGNSIEGGTSEVQLNVISKRVLGLPS